MKNFNIKILAAVEIMLTLVAGGAWAFHMRTPQEITTVHIDENTQLFTSTKFGVSFAYPSSFFVREGEKEIIVSPMSFDDVRQASSIGIVSNLTIATHPESYLRDVSTSTEQGMEVAQTELMSSGHPAILQYYTGAYGGEKNYTLFVEYSHAAGKATLLEAHYTDSLFESTYKTLLESLVVLK